MKKDLLVNYILRNVLNMFFGFWVFFFGFVFCVGSWSLNMLVLCIMTHQERAIVDNTAQTYLDIESFFFFLEQLRRA